MGGGTYEKVLTFDSCPYEKFHVIVLSTTLPDDADVRVTVARSLPDVRTLLDVGTASTVYIDGGRVLTEFLRHGLIDESTITRAPTLLGRGLPCFTLCPTKLA